MFMSKISSKPTKFWKFSSKNQPWSSRGQAKRPLSKPILFDIGEMKEMTFLTWESETWVGRVSAFSGLSALPVL